MGTVLSRLADDARRQRRHDLEAAVRRLPVRLSFPLVCCSLPAFVLLTVVPLVAQDCDASALWPSDSVDHGRGRPSHHGPKGYHHDHAHHPNPRLAPRPRRSRPGHHRAALVLLGAALVAAPGGVGHRGRRCRPHRGHCSTASSTRSRPECEGGSAHDGERGQAALEFALCLPILALLLLALVQVGLVVCDQVAVVHAAREGARAAAVTGPAQAARWPPARAVRLDAGRLAVDARTWGRGRDRPLPRPDRCPARRPVDR